MILQGLTLTQFWLIFGGIGFIYILIYLLRWRKQGRTVSSTLIWQRVMGRSRTIWQHLLSLLLALSVLFLMCAALAEPRFGDKRAPARRFAAIVDTSISMLAREQDGSRFELVKKETGRLIDKLGDNDRMMLVAAGTEVRALTGFTGDRIKLREALSKMEIAGSDPKLSQAIDYSASALKFADEQNKTELHLIVLTDNPSAAQKPEEKDIAFQSVGIGGSKPNLAITAFDARSAYNNAPGKELLVRVDNLSDFPASAELIVMDETHTYGRELLQIQPRGAFQKVALLPFGVSGKITALLRNQRFDTPTGPASDALSIDDAAFLYLYPETPIRVLLVTRGNVFLHNALNLDPQIALSVLDPQAYSPAASGKYEVVVFDSLGLPQPSTRGALYFGIRSGGPFVAKDTIKEPSFVTWEDAHPILKYIHIQDMELQEATPIVAQQGDQILAAAFEGGMIVLREEGSQKLLGLAFDLIKSDLPMRPAFPILMHDAVVYLAGREESPQKAGYQVGENVPITVGTEATEIAVSREGSEAAFALPVREGIANFKPYLPGFYKVGSQSGTSVVAVSLLDKRESDLTVAAGSPMPSFSAGAGARHTDRIVPWLLLIAITLLTFDWVVFHAGRLP